MVAGIGRHRPSQRGQGSVILPLSGGGPVGAWTPTVGSTRPKNPSLEPTPGGGTAFRRGAQTRRAAPVTSSDGRQSSSEPSEPSAASASSSSSAALWRRRSVPAAATIPTPTARSCLKYAGLASSSEALSKFLAIAFLMNRTLICGRSAVTAPCISTITAPNLRLFWVSITSEPTFRAGISIVAVPLFRSVLICFTDPRSSIGPHIGYRIGLCKQYWTRVDTVWLARTGCRLGRNRGTSFRGSPGRSRPGQKQRPEVS